MKNKILLVLTMLLCIGYANAQVSIKQVGGWFESAYLTWEHYTGADMYNVYVKEASSSTWTQLDKELIRNYGYYGRADMVGLAAGSYQFKIEATNGGTVIAGSEATSQSVTVKNYDRAGFAHLDGVAVGAYNNDGTLKSNARVLYIDNTNVDNVTLPVLNGKTETTLTGLGEILKGYEKGLETRPLAVRFVGDINMTSSQLYGDADAMQLKGKANNIAMQVTFEGIGNDAYLSDWGLVLVKCNNVEVRNLGIMLFNDDGISLKESVKVWVHNCDIFYGKAGSAADQNKGDGSLDVKDDSQYCTYSYIHFWDAGKMALCGMKSESGPNYMSYHHNWFDHSDSRHPRVRRMTVHVYNNYYDGVSKYGVGATTGSSIFVESNYFRNTNRPMMSSKQGTDATGDGTFSGETGGIIKSYGNLFVECSNNFSYITANSVEGSGATAVSATSFDAYHATSRDEQVPSSYTTLSGGTSYDNFDTNSSLMYTYTPDEAIDVPAKVKAQAGRMQGGDFTWLGFDNAAEDHNYEIITGLMSAVTGYKTTLVEIGAFTKTTSAPATYTVTYYADVEGTQVYEVMNNQTAVVYPQGTPTKEGYTFTGWSAFQGSRLASNVEIYPTFTDGKNSSGGTTTGGESTTVVNKWVFTSWSSETQTAVTNDAEWVKNSDGTNRYDRTFSTATDLGFAETEGITFQGKVRISWDTSKGQYLQGTFTMNVPVKAGQIITVNFANTGSSNGTRDLLIDGNVVASSSNTSATNGTYTVPEGKDYVTVAGSAGLNYFGITVSEVSGEEGGKETPTFAFSATSATADLAAANNTYPTLSNTSDGAVTYVSTNTNVATIDQDGVITLVALGVTTIRATVAETDNYKSATAQYQLTVTDSSIPTYTVTFMVEDEVYEVMENQTVVVYPANNPTLSGYTFAGWDVAAGTVLTTDLTVNAKWNAIPTYTVTFMVDDEEYEVMENQTVVVYPATNPSKDGYIFTGWDVAAGTVLTSDLTVNGSFELAVAETITLKAGAFPEGYTVDGATSGSAYTYSDLTKASETFTLDDGDHTITLPTGMKATKVVFYGCSQNNAAKSGLTSFNGESQSVEFVGRKSSEYTTVTFDNVDITGEIAFSLGYNSAVKIYIDVEPYDTAIKTTEMDGNGMNYDGRNITANGAITVYNLQGYIVMTGNHQVDVTSLTQGIYIVHSGNNAMKIVR